MDRWGGCLFVLVAIAAATGERLHLGITRWHSNRLAHQALALLEREDYTGATPKIRDALQLNFQNKAASLAAARFLSRTGKAAGALEWWRKVATGGTLTAADRRDYAAAGLASGALDEAERQITELLGHNAAPFPVDLLLAAQLSGPTAREMMRTI